MYMTDVGEHPSESRWPWLLLLLLGLPLFFWLPWLQRGIFASPDETSVRLIALQLWQHGHVWLTEPLASVIPWLHPRSFVSFGERIVPVGFLAWPLLIASFSWVGGTILPWLTSAFLWSSLYPAYRLLRQWFTAKAAWLGTIVAYTTPALILYGNRSLFPNPALWAASLWGLWALSSLSTKRFLSWFLLGIWITLTIGIRPVELFWLGPWFAWTIWSNWERIREQKKALSLGVIIAGIGLLLVNLWTYGSLWRIGYWLRDNPGPQPAMVTIAASSLIRFFPFGVHPANILWNTRHFLFGLLWPWAVFMLACGLFFLWKRRTSRQAMVTGGVLLWTMVSLILFYGNGLYADHVRAGAVTIGNSFLRYLLPMAAVIGLAMAWLVDQASNRWLRRCVYGLAIGLCCFGVYRAGFADEEGVWTTGHELQRYAVIRTQALAVLPEGTVVLSERSDKIFFAPLRAVSPLPPVSEIRRLVDQSGTSVAVFIRPPSQAERDAWSAVGLELWLVQSFGRENLYKVTRHL